MFCQLAIVLLSYSVEIVPNKSISRVTHVAENSVLSSGMSFLRRKKKVFNGGSGEEAS